MSFPNYPNKQNGESILNPQDILAFRRRLGIMPKGEAPESVLICLQRGLPERMRWRVPIQRAGRLMGDLFAVRKARGRVAVLTNLGIGAPQMAAAAEELIAWGARTLVSLVWGGGLQADLSPGDIVVVDRAIRDEGTSHHYLPPQKYISASPALVSRLEAGFAARGIAVQRGASWTLDASYRETREEVQAYEAEGVKTVEMEIAALLAVAQVRGAEAASVVVVGDTLSGLRWRAPQDTRPVERSLEAAYRTIIETLSER